MKRQDGGLGAVVLGHVAPTPWEAADAGKALVGKTITAAYRRRGRQGRRGGAKPLSQNAYKVQLAKVAVKRALLDAVKVKA